MNPLFYIDTCIGPINGTGENRIHELMFRVIRKDINEWTSQPRLHSIEPRSPSPILSEIVFTDDEETDRDAESEAMDIEEDSDDEDWGENESP